VSRTIRGLAPKTTILAIFVIVGVYAWHTTPVCLPIFRESHPAVEFLITSTTMDFAYNTAPTATSAAVGYRAGTDVHSPGHRKSAPKCLPSYL
jgi:hypothetical protein